MVVFVHWLLIVLLVSYTILAVITAWMWIWYYVIVPIRFWWDTGWWL